MTPGGHEQGDIVPVLSGESYTVICATQPGANPPADLEWTSTTAQIIQGDKEDEEVTGSKLTASSKEVTFTPSMADHLTSVTCEATHPALESSLTKFIQLDVQVPPRNVNIALQSATLYDGGTLTLQEGTPSTITCESLGTRPASAITWYLDGVQVSSGVGRPEFSPNVDDSRLQDASSSIVIQPTKAQHEQVLRCQATTFGISHDTSIRLSVDGPPDQPVIAGIPDNINENQQTTVSCQADNGHPSPSFQWFIGSRNLSADATLQVRADAKNRIDATSQLRYLPIREDNGLALQCNVIHDQLSQPMRVMSDTLVVNYCPTTVEVTICPEVEEGSSEVMVCRSGSSNPASNLVWIKGITTITEPNALQTHFEESTEPLGTRTTLSYMRNFNKEDYTKSFKCCTTLSPSCDSTVCSEPCVPNVKYAPEMPTISRNMPNRQVTEGTADLEFTCRADGNPRPALTWVKAENEGLMLDQLTKEDGSQLLRFREVRRHHGGVYKCIANNNILPRSSRDDQLIVYFPPTIQNKANNRATANEGKNASLSCIVKGNPSPQVTWERLGNLSLSNRTLEVNTVVNSDYESVVTSTLNILNEQPDIDHGNYKCTAESSAGRDEAVITLISGTYAPKMPTISRNMPGRQVTEGTADLEFSCRADGNPRPSLTWVMANNEGLTLDQLTKEDGSQLLRFREVRRHHGGVYRCIANNNIPPRSSNDDQLIVRFPPTIENKANNRTTANEGKAASLSCIIKGNPSPQVNWERLGNHSVALWNRTLVVNTEVNSDYQSMVTSTLNIVDVHPDIDHGNYKCTAESTAGRDETVINLSGTLFLSLIKDKELKLIFKRPYVVIGFE
ncbi:nephrin [Strongylocentrotus purpuratus]|uniref:Ig-like domain-containing protein n=1 Tax=Strongylocentrotus purpuratus TaxID=7668 RepID=A0A7M7SVJ3_STRPU|nr:nephrin [Strongylocentrotus purpuratus]